MMRTPLLAFLAAFVLIALPRSITAQNTCSEGFLISRVTMPETTHLVRPEQAAIRARLIGHCLDEQQLAGLVGQVRETLQMLGYFRATVNEPSMTITDATGNPRTASLDLKFREGPRLKVGNVEISGYNSLSAEQIYAVVPISPGDYFDITKVREAADAVRRLYVANGYPNASIIHDVQFREGMGKPTVGVIFRIVEGKQQID